MKSNFWNIVLLLVSWHLERSVSVACMIRECLITIDEAEFDYSGGKMI